jgi:hypothetical protein
VAGVDSKHSAEAVTLSRSAMEISNGLVGLGVSPILDIPACSQSAQDVLMVPSLILECLQEEHDTGAGSWV